jgi:two-component system cell cycle sensor histidine kinase PleC
MEWRAIALRFDAPLELEFASEYFDRTLTQVRLAVLLGFFLYTVFAALDWYVSPGHIRELWLVRLVVSTLILACFAFTYAPAFRRYHDVGLSATMSIAGAGLVTMITIIDVPGSYVYYAGLLVVLMFAPLVRLSITSTLAASTLIIVLFLGAALRLTRAPPPFIAYNVSYLVSTMIVALMANYSIERYARTNFLQRRVIQLRTQELEEKNTDLLAKNPNARRIPRGDPENGAALRADILGAVRSAPGYGARRQVSPRRENRVRQLRDRLSR